MPYAVSLQNSICLCANLIPCAHLCRYCSISSNGERHVAQVSFQRFFTLANRFKEWCSATGFSFLSAPHNSDDITDKVAAFLDETIGTAGTVHAQPITPEKSQLRTGMVRTGGVRFRSDDEIRMWLSRWRDAGSTMVHGAFAGYREVHDWWNNRQGDYDFLIRIQQIAMEMGFEISQTIFLMKNTLPSVDRLIDDLDNLPVPPRNRYTLPVAYLGRARSEAAECQRMTEQDRNHIQSLGIKINPPRVKLQSERERIAAFYAGEADTASFRLLIRVDEQNIDFFESATCEEIVNIQRAKVKAAYDALPSREELMEWYGNPNGTKIYGSFDDLERVWFDRYAREKQNISIERELTHLL